MKVFISWSGDRAQRVAKVLAEQLPNVIQCIETFMSDRDLESGARWSLQLAEKLEEAEFGILCLTRDNLDAPWLLFEAGALTKHIKDRACGLFLDGLSAADVTGPLAQFQHRELEKSDFKKLMDDINGRLESPLEESRLTTVFEKWWPTIEEECNAALRSSPAPAAPTTPRDVHKILDEVLSRVRNIERSIAAPERPSSAPRRTVDHFYTVSAEEANRARLAEAYTREVIACYVHETNVAGTTPLFRLVSPRTGDHFYTTDEQEQDTAVSRSGYTYERVACFVYREGREGTVPLFRLWNPTVCDHLYTISADERERAISALGYRDEGIAAYVYGSPVEGTVPLLRLFRGRLTAALT